MVNSDMSTILVEPRQAPKIYFVGSVFGCIGLVRDSEGVILGQTLRGIGYGAYISG